MPGKEKIRNTNSLTIENEKKEVIYCYVIYIYLIRLLFLKNKWQNRIWLFIEWE